MVEHETGTGGQQTLNAASEQVLADSAHQQGIVFQNQDAILDGTSDAAILAVRKTCAESSALLKKQCFAFCTSSSTCACGCCKVTLQGYEPPLWLDDEEISLHYNWQKVWRFLRDS